MRNGSRTTHGIIDVRLWLMKTDPSTELPQEMLQEARKMLQLILAECEDGNKVNGDGCSSLCKLEN